MYDIAVKTNLQNVTMTVANLDPEQYHKAGWTVVGRLVGLDSVLCSARVVVTHLGYTLWEAISYGIPVVIVPNPAWKRSSVKEMEKVCEFIEKSGFGVYVGLDGLTPQNLEKAVQKAESMTLPRIEIGAKKAANTIREIER